MGKKAFDKIAGGLAEAIAVAKGNAKPFKMHVPAEIDIKALRKSLGLTQEDFASSYGFSTTQVKDWEQGRSRPLGGLRAYLLLIAQDPEEVREMLSKAQTAASRSRKVA